MQQHGGADADGRALHGRDERFAGVAERGEKSECRRGFIGGRRHEEIHDIVSAAEAVSSRGDQDHAHRVIRIGLVQRVAIVEDGKLAELFVESEEKERMVGDVYIGTVAKVMPGIQAAFINIGLEQDAFLHYSDIGDAFRETRAEGTAEERGEAGEDEAQDKRPDAKPQKRRRRPPSVVTLARGQEIVVQIFKEPVGSKGVRVTTEVALPGRFLVLMP